jgi:acyl-CoA thioesterase-1
MTRFSIRLIACALLLAPTFLLAADPAPKPAPKPATKPATKPTARPDSMKPIADDPALPRVLLIGDSISIGYTLPTRAKLAGKANVHRIPTNGGPTPNGLKNIDAWLGDKKWDVIHFNWGLHDLKYHDGKGTIVPVEKGTQQVPPEEYEKNLRTLVKRLKQTNAKLIWATTTPVPPDYKGRIPADVPKYNEIAAKIMKEEGVETDDLFTFITPKLAETQNKADVHYNAKGYDALAGQVAAVIEKALAERK